ncbi:MAG TPA: hypothetical protein VM695_04135, partial [Phycisphaerae bacterium]|nr:hypothetical protein [Phycisphaerae bacterium]
MLRHARTRQVGRGLLLALLAGAAAGCPYVPPETDYPHIGLTDPVTDTSYWLYKPSYYDQLDDCPLVVTLHGTNPWDGRTRQVLEWRDTAEQFGLIVVAPQLQSTQGYMPVIPSIWYADDRKLAHDERAILAVVDHVRRTHRIAKRTVQRPSPDGTGPPEVVEKDLILLTGFSSGGFPLYYTGLRNPDSFDMVIARDCNSSLDLFQKIEITDATRQLPVTIFWGKDDATIREQSWDAFRFLREHRCFKVERKTIPGGHLRRPDVAIRLWSERLPKKYLR